MSGAALLAILALAFAVAGGGKSKSKVKPRPVAPGGSGSGSGSGSGGQTPSGPGPLFDTQYLPGVGTPPDAIAVGQPDDPEIAALLAELEATLVAHGVPKVGWSAEEITRMHKTPTRAIAIPPRGMWLNMVPTLRLYVMLRERMGVPFALGGYRPPDYNAAMEDAAPRSTHMWFAALDITLVGTDKNANTLRQKLGTEASILFLENPGTPMGLGIYSVNPARVHVDYGSKRRVWEDEGEAWVREVADMLGVPSGV